MNIIEVKVPDIGGFEEVDVIELLVKPGDSVTIDQSLMTVESDKASMEIPSTHAGMVKEIHLKIGDKVAKDSLILSLDTQVEPTITSQPLSPSPVSTQTDIVCDTLVLGAGPGGYTAAFRAADLGQKVVLVERFPALGGVCLNVGCIPSKALLHVATVITQAEEITHCGITMSSPTIDLDRLRDWKNSVIQKLTDSISTLAKKRKVQVVTGQGRFTSPHMLTVTAAMGEKTIAFKQAIIAAGSSVAKIPGLTLEDPRLIDSTDALNLLQIPKRLLIVGGGIIGLEMACMYDALGSKVTLVEVTDRLILAVDHDVMEPLQKRIEKRYEAIYLKTKVSQITPIEQGLRVHFEAVTPHPDKNPEPQIYDQVLLATGRCPNGKQIGAELAGIRVDTNGFIRVDKQQRTNVPHIFAVGDICGTPMLAHKATYEAKIAAEVISGHQVRFDASTIPSVAYTDPEVAWMGMTEKEAQETGIVFEKAKFPWTASGRALAMGRDEGMTKLLWDPATKRLLGAGIVGVGAGELLAELVLAMEMGADIEDLALTIHAHPTLSETLMLAAELGVGTITDLFVPKKG